MIEIDKPIYSIEEDKLSRDNFVDSLKRAILDYSKDDALVIGLTGEWGSGKTSILNLLKKSIESEAEIESTYKFISFNPWAFKETDDLLQQFFQEFYKQLKIKDYSGVPHKIGNGLSHTAQVIKLGNFIPVIAPFSSIIAPLVKEYGELLKESSYKKSSAVYKNKISNKLKKYGLKLVIYIDDIDRLNDKEINQIFQLVKLLADFDNVIYVLAYDPNVVVSALRDSQKDYAKGYLEKIVQVSLDIPLPAQNKMSSLLSERLNWYAKDLPDFEQERVYQFWRTGVLSQFKTIRDINRFINAFGFKFSPMKKEVDFFDFAVLTVLELKHNYVYKCIAKNKDILCGNSFSNGGDSKQSFKNGLQELESYIKVQKSDDSNFINQALGFLFPKYWSVFINNTFVTTDNYYESKFKGRIFVKERFDLFFSLSLNDVSLSNEKIYNMVFTLGKEEFNIFLKTLIEDETFSEFITTMNGILYSIEPSRLYDICLWINDISNDIPNIERPALSVDPIMALAYMFVNFFKDINLFDKLNEIIENKEITVLATEIILEIERIQGCYKKEGAPLNKVISDDEFALIESKFANKTKSIFASNQILAHPAFIRLFYFVGKLDPSFIKTWSNDIIHNSELCFDLIVKLVTRGEILSYTNTKTYHYDINSLKEYLDTEKVYNIIKDCCQHYNGIINSDYYILVSYLMSYEKYGERETYTITQIQQYCKDNKYKYENRV